MDKCICKSFTFEAAHSLNITKNNNLSYIYNLNMSNAEAGIYLIRLGNSTVGYKTGRIIVK